MAPDLNTWAARWGLPAQALHELRAIFTGEDAVPPPPSKYTSEAGAQTAVRLEAAGKGCILWRNNVGALQDQTGRMVRYGLANESKAVNERIKSSDLIGIRPRLITPGDVGTVVGQFIAREMKAPGWTYTGTEREVAQLRYLQIVSSFGGDATFCTGEGSL